MAVAFVPALGLTVGTALVIVLGVAAIGVGLRAVSNRRSTPVEALQPPAVEARTTVTIPGHEVDAQLADLASTTGTAWIDSQRSLTRRLEALATATLARSDSARDEASAATLLETGEWTDDEFAQRFFTGDREQSSLPQRLQSRLGSARPAFREARHVIDELATLADVEDRVWTDPEEMPESDDAIDRRSIDSLALSSAPTDRWVGVSAVVMLSVGVAVLSGTPALLLAGAVGAGFVAFARSGRSELPTLAVERRVDQRDPEPGATVTVTVEVENVGGAPAFDLRIVDGVPPGLSVVAGSPRHGTALRPGASAAFSYDVRVERGEHAFQPTLVIGRDASGALEHRTTVSATGTETVTARPTPTADISVPVRAKTSRDVGRVVTDVGGSGIEFHSVREYRHGDPLKRIDWNRLAAGGGLATLQFREERSATVMLLVDARKDAYLARDRDGASAVDLSVAAAAESFVGLLDSDDRVGLAALSPRDCWLAPGAGAVHWARARAKLTSDPAFGTEPPELPDYPTVRVRQLRKRLPASAQLVLFSPLCDDSVALVARRLEAYDYPVTVVSPDVTGTETPGRTVAAIERRLRLSRLRDAGVRVVDWHIEDPLEVALVRAQRRWAR
jgi:uncharacterized repeat protein (TIGR01451 family)